jgi:hypothetical protein
MANTGRLARNEGHATSKALLGAAVLYLVPGLLYWPVAGLKFDLNDWVRILGCAVLAAMGLWARWAPLPPAIMCSALYTLLLGVQAYQGLRWHPIVWILHGAIVLLLLVGLVSAIRERMTRPVKNADTA